MDIYKIRLSLKNAMQRPIKIGSANFPLLSLRLEGTLDNCIAMEPGEESEVIWGIIPGDDPVNKFGEKSLNVIVTIPDESHKYVVPVQVYPVGGRLRALIYKIEGDLERDDGMVTGFRPHFHPNDTLLLQRDNVEVRVTWLKATSENDFGDNPGPEVTQYNAEIEIRNV